MTEPELTGIAELVPFLIQLIGAGHPVAQLLMLLTSLVGSASALTKIVTIISRITPNTKDDQFASKMQKGVSRVLTVLDKVALNPDDQHARRR